MPPKLVLLVDDDPDVRESLADYLRAEDYDVVEACNGKQALERLGKEPRPSCIVLDLMMPVMDGQTFLHEKQKDGRFDSIPVLAVTAGNANLRQHVVGTLRKPFDIDQLMQVISHMCAAA